MRLQGVRRVYARARPLVVCAVKGASRKLVCGGNESGRERERATQGRRRRFLTGEAPPRAAKRHRRFPRPLVQKRARPNLNHHHHHHHPSIINTPPASAARKRELTQREPKGDRVTTEEHRPLDTPATKPTRLSLPLSGDDSQHVPLITVRRVRLRTPALHPPPQPQSLPAPQPPRAAADAPNAISGSPTRCLARQAAAAAAPAPPPRAVTRTTRSSLWPPRRSRRPRSSFAT